MPINKNMCECPTPPGGRAVCEAHQLAICRVRNGVAETECIDPPRFAVRVSPRALTNWALSAVTRKARPYDARINKEDFLLLTRGEFFDHQSSTTVRFKVPKSLARFARTRARPFGDF